jgi:hypothetical protein
MLLIGFSRWNSLLSNSPSPPPFPRKLIWLDLRIFHMPWRYFVIEQFRTHSSIPIGNWYAIQLRCEWVLMKQNSYSVQNYWDFWLCPLSGILETRKHNVRKLDLFPSSGEGGKTPLLDPLEWGNLNHWATPVKSIPVWRRDRIPPPWPCES